MKKFIFMLIVIVYTITNANAFTIVPPGPILSTTWNNIGSPYIVTGFVNIPLGNVLFINTTIGPVEVQFAGPFSLTVFGNLVAVGSPVSNCSYSQQRDLIFDGGGWNGIIITAGSGVSLFDCEITGVLNNPAITLQSLGGGGSSVNIWCCAIHGNTNNSGAGGIYSTNTQNANITNNRIFSNQGSTAGGIYEDNSSNFNISGNDIVGNTSTGDGGGVNLYNSNETYSGNRIDSNSAGGNGGGVNILGGGTANLIGNYINNNSAYNGGGIYSTTSPTNITSSNIIDYNMASNSGGGIYVYYSQLSLLTNHISNNNCPTSGAGIYISTQFNVNIYGNHIDSNNYNNISNTNYGGGVYIEYSNTGVHLVSNWINNNYALNGGGVYLTNSDVDFSGNELAYNGSYYNGGGGFIDHNTEPITNNHIHDNISTPSGNGGGLYVTYTGSVMSYAIQNNVFKSNQCSFNGGGLNVSHGMITVNSNNYIWLNTSGQDGGGIYLYDIDDPTGYSSITNNTITYNTSNGNGGGIYEDNSNSPFVAIWSNKVDSNLAQGNGGGIYCYGGTTSINQNNVANGDISYDTAINQGGGLYIAYSNNLTDGITFNSNISQNGGGGVYFLNSIGNFGLNSVTLNNSPTGNGGGIFMDNSNTTIEDNHIDGNNANSGGGIYSQNLASGTSSIESNTLINDNATINGGGLYITSGNTGLTIHILNNLIVHCYATGTNPFTGEGGGMYFDISSSTPVVNSNTIADNWAAIDGGGIWSNFPLGIYENDILYFNTPNSANAILSSGGNYPNFIYSDILGYTGLFYIAPNWVRNDDPQFETPGTNYRLGGVLHIPLESPCIDVGDNTAIHTAYDLDLIPRISNGGFSLTIDMGAYENLNGMNPQYALSINNQNNKENKNFTVYPNPFKVSTNINFSVPDNSDVKIGIYDMMGKSIKTITEKNYPSGNYNIVFENENLPKGVYICELLINNNKTNFKKIIVE